MSRTLMNGSVMVFVLALASTANAERPVIVDGESVGLQTESLATSLTNLRLHAQVVATSQVGTEAYSASIYQLQNGLQQVAAQMKALDEQIKKAGPATGARGRGRPGPIVGEPLPRQGDCPPPMLCPPPVQCPPQVACACPPSGVVVQTAPVDLRNAVIVRNPRDREGRDREGRDREGWDREGRDRDARDREERRREAPVATGDAQLQSLLAAVNAEGFSEDKQRVFAAGAATQWFTVAQAIQAVGQFSFSEDKLNALRVLAPRIIDRSNIFRIYGALTFSADKSAARQILEP